MSNNPSPKPKNVAADSVSSPNAKPPPLPHKLAILSKPPKPMPPPQRPFLLRLVSLFIKAVVLLIFLMALDQLIPSLRQQLQPYATQSWQYMTLMQQELPTENSLPNPLIDRHLTDTWGGARSEGRTHEGTDIFAKRGTPIHATTHGIVQRVGQDRLGGNVVVIAGPGGAGHYYAHLEEFAEINKGDWVNAGDVIGYVGDSGNAKGTPPHVHYGVYINGSAVNPYPLLVKN